MVLILHSTFYIQHFYRLNGEAIAAKPESADYSEACGRNHRAVAELLSLMHIADVHFDDRRLYGLYAVRQCYAGVGVGSGVQHDAVGRESHFLHLVYQLALDVALVIVNLHIGKLRRQLWQKLLERAASVDVRLAFAEQIEVWAVNDSYFHLF